MDSSLLKMMQNNQYISMKGTYYTDLLTTFVPAKWNIKIRKMAIHIYIMGLISPA